MTEKWNAYRADGSLTDLVLYRDHTIPAGHYHLVVEAMIRHKDGDLLLVQRHPHKLAYPNHWEFSAGGSALFGEMAEQAIRREVLEETGLELNQLDLFDTFVNEKYQCYFKVFLATTEQDKASVTLQVEETIDYRWVKPADLLDFMSKNQLIPRHEKTLRQLFIDKKD